MVRRGWYGFSAKCRLGLFPSPALKEGVDIGSEKFNDGSQRVVVGNAVDIKRTSDKVQVAVCEVELIGRGYVFAFDVVKVSEFVFLGIVGFPFINSSGF